MTPISSRRWVRIALAISIAMTLLGGLAGLYILSAGTHALTVDNAVQRFRSAPAGGSTSAPSTRGTAQATASSRATAKPSPGSNVAPSARPPGGAAGRQDPPVGVYVYDTQGYESTDALTGSRHDYPASTTITVERAGCGYVFRWQPLQERWDESEGCRTTTGVRLKRFSMYHEFFRRGVRENFSCGADAIVMPWTPKTGDRWSWGCSSPNSKLEMTIRVVDLASVRVGGRSVPAMHLRYEARVSGEDQGTLIQERWLARDTGLFLRILSDGDLSVQTPFGRARYAEHYRIDLTSLEPKH